MKMVLTFHDVQFEIVDREDQVWIRLSQIATALGYASVQRVTELYSRHADEFSDSMTALVKLPTEGGEQETRIFSLRGCHLLAMFARTPVAKAFRKWVLDVLERLAEEESSNHAQYSPDSLTPDQQCTLKALVKARVESIPEDERPKGLFPQIWSRFNNHFRLGSYKQLPQHRLSEAITYLAQLDILPKKKAIEAKPETLEIPEDMESRRKRICEELWDIEKKCVRLIDEMRFCLQPGAKKMFLPEEMNISYKILEHLNYTAISSLYAVRNSLIVAWQFGKGKKFV